MGRPPKNKPTAKQKAKRKRRQQAMAEPVVASPETLALFAERLQAIVPADRLQAVREGLAEPSTVGFRVNTLKTTVTEAIETLQAKGLHPSPVAWADTAWTVPADERAALVDHPLTIDGAVYIQSLSSQWAVAVLDPKPGEEVLDLCAAPGGKTLAIAQRVTPGRLGTDAAGESDAASAETLDHPFGPSNTETPLPGVPGAGVAAVESSKDRFYRMKLNLQRGGAAFVRTYNFDGRTVGRKTPGRFDRVLVDAPCSAETAIDPNVPESVGDWSIKKVERCAKRQVQLLMSAFEAAKPGATLVYATCTLAPEENECVVVEAIRRSQGKLVTKPMANLDQLPESAKQTGLMQWQGTDLSEHAGNMLRLLPLDGMDAFFVTLLEKRI